MRRAPYLIIGVDVHPTHPDPDTLLRRAWEALPALPGLGALGVENVFCAEVAPSRADTLYRDVARALHRVDTHAGGGLRWFVQLCGVADMAEG